MLLLYVLADTVRTRKIDRLVSQLKSPDPAARDAARKELTGLKSHADMRRLIRHLADDDEPGTGDVAAILAAVGAPALKPLAAAAAKATDISFRERLHYALRTERWLPWRKGTVFRDGPFVGSFGSTRQARTKSGILRTFVLIGPPAVDTLVTLSRNRRAPVRQLAIESLKGIHDPRAFDTFVHALKDPDVDIRIAAVDGLDGLKMMALAVLNDPSPGNYDIAAWREYDSKDETAIEPLLACLDDVYEQGSTTVPFALKYYHDDPRVAARLAAIVRDPKTRKYIRLLAAYSIKDSKNPRLSEALADPAVAAWLIASLADRDDNIRSWAARILTNVPDKRKFAPVASLLGDKNPVVQKYARDFFLECPDADRVPALAAAYESANETGKKNAVEVLKDIRYRDAQLTDEAKSALERIAPDSPSTDSTLK